jgi:hypothetical protein
LDSLINNYNFALKLTVKRNEVTETSRETYTLYDHKTSDSVRRELQTECILDKIDEYRRNWFLHLQKKATKPNLFEIISIQTTRKKNNWKTEETLARTIVTLETKRIKGFNS